MLRKLLKYDMRSIGRYWWILALTMVAVSSIAGSALCIAIDAYDHMSDLVGSIAIIVFYLCLMALMISSVFTPLLVFIRYYKHLFTDEGYLTFTLPVRRRDLLHAKTLNALIWTTLYGALMLFCICLVMSLAMDAKAVEISFFEFLGEAFVFIGEFYSYFGVWAWVYTLEAILLSLCTSLLSINLVHFCITLGSVVAKRGKVFAAIGFYYGFNAALTGIFQFVMLFNGWSLIEGFVSLLETASFHMAALAVAILALLLLFILAAPMVLLYCLTRQCLERKLNLA